MDDHTTPQIYDRLQQGYALINANPERAIEILTPAAESGSLQAMIYLGYATKYAMERTRSGTPEQYLDWFKQAYHRGSIEGRRLFGIFSFRQGNDTEAEAVLRKAERDDDISCTYWLAHLLLKRDKDSYEALNLFYKATKSGHIYARGQLGRVLLSGRQGWQKRITGLWLIVSAAVEGYKIASKDKYDYRLK